MWLEVEHKDGVVSIAQAREAHHHLVSRESISRLRNQVSQRDSQKIHSSLLGLRPKN